MRRGHRKDTAWSTVDSDGIDTDVGRPPIIGTSAREVI
jgi:hypothetical protein